VLLTPFAILIICRRIRYWELALKTLLVKFSQHVEMRQIAGIRGFD